MYKELENWLHQAEKDYLNADELTIFKSEMLEWKERLAIYKHLRDYEVVLFQPVAERLQKIYPQENQSRLEQALKHWIAIMRYAAFAMLTNNPEFLQYRILEWLNPVIKTYQLQAIEQELYAILQEVLETLLTEKEKMRLDPFLKQAQDTLLDSSNQLIGENK